MNQDTFINVLALITKIRIPHTSVNTEENTFQFKSVTVRHLCQGCFKYVHFIYIKLRYIQSSINTLVVSKY